jgi:hypothetical protein
MALETLADGESYVKSVAAPLCRARRPNGLA